ncbi:ATP-binding protein [Massilia sp. PWRC2]|uniref:ATP-binding protein n=1 Tax=Massilia sp. PWRC2 TaxID=2804626 RepID=UPI003CF3F920
MLVNFAGELIDINASSARVLALGTDDFATLLRQPLSQLWQAAAHDAIAAALAIARAGGIGRFDTPSTTCAGAARWWDVTIVPAGSGDDGGARLLVLARDVLEQQQADQALRRSQARYRALTVDAKVIEWEADGSGQFDAMQSAWSAFTGQRFDQYCGDGWLEAIHPDDRARSATGWSAARQCRHAYIDEHRLRSADGHYHHMLVRAVPEVDSDGRVRQWVGLHMDAEDRRGAGRQLDLLDAISEAGRNTDSVDALMALSLRMLGEHLGVTHCAYADVAVDNEHFSIRHDWRSADASSINSSTSTIGHHALALFGRRGADHLRAGRTMRIGDVDLELGSGAATALFNAFACKAIVCCPLLDKGRLVAMMALHHHHPRNWSPSEVALAEQVMERCWLHVERVRAAQAQDRAARRQNEFVAILAHELRNPLAPLRNGLQLMQLAADDAVAMAKVRDMMERQVLQMSHLLDDLLDVARVTTGQLDLKRRHLDLAGVLEAAVETTMPLIAASGHSLQLDMPQQPLPLFADPLRLAQVLGNVLNNAAKYTPRGGRITVSARAAGDTVAIRISDTGPGIAPAAHANLFDMFAKTAAAIGRGDGGLGIGLSLSRHLLDLHGGSILLDSSSAAGSSFVICLPLEAALVSGEGRGGAGAASTPAQTRQTPVAL